MALQPASGLALVTGTTGFLGSVLVRQLLAEGARVRVLRRAESALDLLGESAAHVEHALGDLTDVESLEAALQGVETVYHCAAFVGFGGAKDAERLRTVNVVGTGLLADAARRAGVARFVHTSSIAALGRPVRPSPTPIDETAEWRPGPANTAYAVSKHEAEMEVFRATAEGLDAVLVNPAVIFGPGRAGEGTMQIVEQVREERLPLGLAPAGGTCVVDVEDVASGLRLARARGTTGERYILGAENLPWVEILGTLARALKAEPPTRTLAPGLALAAGTLAEGLGWLTRSRPLLTRETARLSGRFYRYDAGKARRELGWTGRPFTETAERIAASLKG